MKTVFLRRDKVMRPTALLVSASMLAPTLAGCGGGQPAPTSQPPMMNQRPAATRPAVNNQRPGMTTKQKVALLAGAAALYYIYNKRKAASAAAGPQGKYYLSKNGRVYYRDLKTGAFQYVSPPSQPIQVPEAEARKYSRYQGYNNSREGQEFGGYGYQNNNSQYTDAVPAPTF